ncbi:asparagine synthase (glutamine-hydrolyzing) [Algoriphagus sp.]|uniref:asparagine synthase (glutamine-hydrolyzing) n=1 Tax=Algoriphagus sp. TaxID=1872435 RepID=UPI00261DA4CB|nr:asparagine synthase (glutamine-hydrolyzing) [Algoriphagus sp.]
MCGIFGIIFKEKHQQIPLRQVCQVIRHRGPDDSGYLLWSNDLGVRILADEETSSESIKFHGLPQLKDSDTFQLAFGHRRLSILDLSPQGHQPMVFNNLSICFNGEVYNYIEVRNKLKLLGRSFQTQTDTEVILQAWDEWGPNCLNQFNGMFAFLIFDSKIKKVFAVRDRFGVKPLYFFENENFIAFSSEVKQLRILPGYKFSLNHRIAYQYLRYGFLDHSEYTFENQIKQVMPGQFFSFDMSERKVDDHKWYSLTPSPFKGSFQEAKEQFKFLLKDAVRLRLRSDVPVGSALSGGLDSSAVVCLMDEILKEGQNPDITLQTVTSSSRIPQFDETKYAQIVNQKVGAKSHQTFPDFEMLKSELDTLIWHMDYPFGSSSQFAQWKVFQAAKKAGLIVMIDGQGADEQLAGYGGNDLFLYSGLLKKGRFSRIIAESMVYKKSTGHFPKGFLLGGLINLIPSKVARIFPKKFNYSYGSKQDWLKHDDFSDYDWKATDLTQNLANQIRIAPLPALLRYEDRNSMAFSVESRTPFMDYRLIEFSLGLPEEFIYGKGERKTILRAALRGSVPDQILDRKDKMGFVSNEEAWLKTEGKEWFDAMINLPIDRLNSEFFNTEKVKDYVHLIGQSKIPFEYGPWRILNFKLWYNQMQRNYTSEQS